MGYTTPFDGTFQVTPPMPHHLVAELNRFSKKRHDEDMPSHYCDWQPTEDGTGIQWDGGEKFYAYQEWLQLLIDKFLKPAGHVVSGRIRYQGEEMHDAGWLSVEDNRVTKRRLC